MTVSNSIVKTYDLSWQGLNQLPDVYNDVAKLDPPVSSESLVLRALTDGAQRWTRGMIQYTLVVNKAEHKATLITNNLVA